MGCCVCIVRTSSIAENFRLSYFFEYYSSVGGECDVDGVLFFPACFFGFGGDEDGESASPFDDGLLLSAYDFVHWKRSPLVR